MFSIAWRWWMQLTHLRCRFGRIDLIPLCKCGHGERSPCLRQDLIKGRLVEVLDGKRVFNRPDHQSCSCAVACHVSVLGHLPVFCDMFGLGLRPVSSGTAMLCNFSILGHCDRHLLLYVFCDGFLLSEKSP